MRLLEPLQCYLFSYLYIFYCPTFSDEAVVCRFCLYKSKRRAKHFFRTVPILPVVFSLKMNLAENDSVTVEILLINHAEEH